MRAPKEKPSTRDGFSFGADYGVSELKQSG